MSKPENEGDGSGSSAHLRGTLGVRAVYTFSVLSITALGVLVIMWLISARMSKWTTMRLLAGTDSTGPYPALAFVACGLAVFAFLIAAVAYKALQGFAIFAIMALVVLLIGCTVTAVVLLMMTNKQITDKKLNPTKFDQWQTYMRIAAWITTGVFVSFIVVLFAKYIIGEKAARKDTKRESQEHERVGISVGIDYAKELEKIQNIQKASSQRSQQLEDKNMQLIAENTELAVQDAARASALAHRVGIERQAAEAKMSLLREEERKRQLSETAASIQLSMRRAEEERRRREAQGKYTLEQGYVAGAARLNEDLALNQAVLAGYTVGAGLGATAAEQNKQAPPVPSLGV